MEVSIILLYRREQSQRTNLEAIFWLEERNLELFIVQKLAIWKYLLYRKEQSETIYYTEEINLEVSIYIYIIEQDIIHIYIYMLRIASQTAGPIRLKFFVDTHGVARGCYRLKKLDIFFNFFSTGNVGPLSQYSI